MFKIKNEFMKKTSKDYILLEEYGGSQKKILIKHILCGREYKVKPSNFVYNGGCKCKIITQKKFAKKIKERYGDDYTLIDFDTFSHGSVVRHNKCGKEIVINGSSFLKGYKCECTTNKTLFNNQIENFTNKEYSVIGNYKGANEFVLFRHNKCGRTFLETPHNFMTLRKQCKECSITSSRSTASFKKYLSDNFKEEFKLKSDYVNCHTPVAIEHRECGITFRVSPKNFKDNPVCPCRKNRRMKFEEYLLVDLKNKYTIEKKYSDIIYLIRHECGLLIKVNSRYVRKMGISCECEKKLK